MFLSRGDQNFVFEQGGIKALFLSWEDQSFVFEQGGIKALFFSREDQSFVFEWGGILYCHTCRFHSCFDYCQDILIKSLTQIKCDLKVH